jgi:hypothetical protein
MGDRRLPRTTRFGFVALPHHLQRAKRVQNALEIYLKSTGAHQVYPPILNLSLDSQG